MGARFDWKDIPRADREQISQAVTDSIDRHEGDWNVKISEAANGDAWDIRIEGPDGFLWSHRFAGPERAPTIIRNSVRAAIEMAVGDLNLALAELIRQGITFTTQPRSDGGTDYIIDRVALREEEVTQLAKQGTLTRDGIRSYLVSR